MKRIDVLKECQVCLFLIILRHNFFILTCDICFSSTFFRLLYYKRIYKQLFTLFIPTVENNSSVTKEETHVFPPLFVQTATDQERHDRVKAE